MEGIRDKVLIPPVTSPVIGFLLGLAVMVVIFNVFGGARPRFMNDTFRRLQVISAGYMALSHGSNDAQKTMGVTLALLNAGVIDEFVVPIEVKLLAATAISLGTAAGDGGSSRRWAPGGQAGPGARLRGGDVGGHHHLRRLEPGHAGQHHPHHLQRDHGYRRIDRFSAIRWGVARNIGLRGSSRFQPPGSPLQPSRTCC